MNQRNFLSFSFSLISTEELLEISCDLPVKNTDHIPEPSLLLDLGNVVLKKQLPFNPTIHLLPATRLLFFLTHFISPHSSSVATAAASSSSSSLVYWRLANRLRCITATNWIGVRSALCKLVNRRKSTADSPYY